MKEKTGLTEQEAKARLVKFGPNEIAEPSPSSSLKVFLSQFKSFLVLILLLAAGVSLLIGERLDFIFIFLIVILNAAIGFFQEAKAEREVRALKNLIVPQARVVRNGKEKIIRASEIVPGDLVVLSQGDKIPADGVLIEGTALLVNEAVLTGESVPVEKEVLPPGNLLFMGTTVLSGHGNLQVTTTGMNTEFGKIAKELGKTKKERTPLEEKITNFSKVLGLGILSICLLIFLLGILRGRPFLLMLLESIALAVAAIPEGLPTILTITLAIGMQRMAKKRAIVRKILATETLGSVEVILSDKTGTLTKNEMTVREIVTANGGLYKVGGVGYQLGGEVKKISNFILRQAQDNAEQSRSIKRDPAFEKILTIGILCNTSSLVLKENHKDSFEVLGDTTEGALLILGKKVGLPIEDLKNNFPIEEELPFDPERRLMTVVTRTPKGERLVLTKGAPENVLFPSTKYLTEEGKEAPLTKEKRGEIEEKINQMGGRGLRVLGFAYKEKRDKEELEANLVFLGLVGIADPPRPEVAQAVLICRQAGIFPLMITGDNAQTARSVAEEIGLIKEGEEVVEGEQFKEFPQEIFEKILTLVKVFARMAPSQKLKIVEEFQKKGLVVAVTGDGVNDAPALKRADVGVAMGQTGTDVAKEASDIIITDDNFATIVSAIEEGRVIFANLLKAIKYLLSCNLAEVLVIFLTTLFSLPLPLTPLQLLWINVVSDGLPAIALGVDSRDPHVMRQLPRGRKGAILSFPDFLFIGGVGVVQALIALLTFILILARGGEPQARLATFSLFVILEMMVVFLVRGKRQRLFSNKLLILAVLLTLFLQGLILATPSLREIFS